MSHRWKLSWPGNYCLDCGLDDPTENTDNWIPCPYHKAMETEEEYRRCGHCGGAGLILDPDLTTPECPGQPS